MASTALSLFGGRAGVDHSGGGPTPGPLFFRPGTSRKWPTTSCVSLNTLWVLPCHSPSLDTETTTTDTQRTAPFPPRLTTASPLKVRCPSSLSASRCRASRVPVPLSRAQEDNPEMKGGPGVLFTIRLDIFTIFQKYSCSCLKEIPVKSPPLGVNPAQKIFKFIFWREPSRRETPG